jgi:transposase-like protein
VVEQRYLAVRGADSGAKISEVATRYGVDRRTVHRWLQRYANGGLGALADGSCDPDRCPHQITPEVEAQIVAMRRAHPGWGPRTILNELRRQLDEVRRVPRSITVSCATVSSHPNKGDAKATTTSAGRGRSGWRGAAASNLARRRDHWRRLGEHRCR